MMRDRSVVVVDPTSAALAGRLLDLDLADPILDEVIGPSVDELTVVVPVRDNTAGVERLLAGLASHVTCLVVDDASTEGGSLDAVVRAYAARLVQLDRNVGPAAARNVGLAQVRTPYVAFIDSDVEVSPDALAQLLRHLADPLLAAVAPRVLSADRRGWLGRYEAASGSLDLGPSAATVRRWSPVAYVPSACLVARVNDVGVGFDPSMRSGEDVDLVWRLTDAGHRVRYAAEVAVVHDIRTTASRWLARKAFYGFSAAPLEARHGARVAPAVLSPMTAGVAAGLLVQRRWSITLAGVCAAATIRKIWKVTPDLSSTRRRVVVATAVADLYRQTSNLALRHWSPAVVVLSLFSRRTRHAVIVLAVADGIVDHGRRRPDLDLVRYALARRAEHLAYGLGVWCSAVEARSAACLLPHWVVDGRRECDS